MDWRRAARLDERARTRAARRPRAPAPHRASRDVRFATTSPSGAPRTTDCFARRAPTTVAVAEVMERLTLEEYAERDVITLSGGERQRMVLARALAQTTKVMVLDEPITGLDLRHQMAMLELLQREVRENGFTVLATLHDLTLAGQFADRLVLLTADGSCSTVPRARSCAARSFRRVTEWNFASSTSTAPTSLSPFVTESSPRLTVTSQ